MEDGEALPSGQFERLHLMNEAIRHGLHALCEKRKCLLVRQLTHTSWCACYPPKPGTVTRNAPCVYALCPQLTSGTWLLFCVAVQASGRSDFPGAISKGLCFIHRQRQAGGKRQQGWAPNRLLAGFQQV